MAPSGNSPTPDEFLDISKFYVEIDGAGIATYFTEVEGLNAQIEVLEYQEGGENSKVHKLVGQTRFPNLILRRGVTGSVEFYNWIKSAIDGDIKRCTGAIHVCNMAGEPVLTYKFQRGWPCRYVGPDLNSVTEDLAIEALEITHEGLEMEQAK